MVEETPSSVKVVAAGAGWVLQGRGLAIKEREGKTLQQIERKEGGASKNLGEVIGESLGKRMEQRKGTERKSVTEKEPAHGKGAQG